MDPPLTDDKKQPNETPTVEQSPAPKPPAAKPQFKCLVCEKTYSKKTSLFTHHKTHPEHCVHCGTNRGSSAENIYEHNLQHINIRPFICKKCGESFLRNQQFVEHEKLHEKPPEAAPEPVVSKDSKYKCKTCDSSYTNSKLFYKHQQESGHYNEKFLCEICGNDFHSNFLLGQHIRRLHKRNADDTFPCNFCAKIFASKPNLDSHVRKIHQNDKSSHICGTCLGTFSSAPNLKQHIKNVHEAEKEFQCETCKKPFKAKNRLTRHEKQVHGNVDEVKVFNCEHCQKKYKRSWHQARHSQMKHENSNSTTTTGTPPTPECNGNIIASNNNNTFSNFNQQTTITTPPIIHQHQPLLQPDMNSNQNAIPSNTWNQQQMQQQQQQQQLTPQQHMYGNELLDQKNYNETILPGSGSGGSINNNGEYLHYAVNEQYSNKFDVQQAVNSPSVPTAVNSNLMTDYMNPTTSWDNYQQPIEHHIQNQQQIYHQQQQQQQQQPPVTNNDWYYAEQQQQQQQNHMYNNYNNFNYKTDFNCLNHQQPAVAQQPLLPHTQQQRQQQPEIQSHQQFHNNTGIYNGANQYYQQQQQHQQLQQYPQNPNPYTAIQQNINHPATMDYQHSNYHTNYHNANM